MTAIQPLIRRMGMLRSNIARFAQHLGARHDDAQDIAQNTLIKAWQHIDDFRGGDCDTELRNWLFAIARNCHYDMCRRTALRELRCGEAARDDYYPCAGEHACQLSDLERALEGLGAQCRETFCEQALGSEYKDIARRTGVPIGTVKSRIARAREALSA